MDTDELIREKGRLSNILNCLEDDIKMTDERLKNGIEAVDAATIEAITKMFIQRIKTLNLVHDKPYFARVDFKPDSCKADELYIGKTTILDENTDVLVIDWRAPISILYYEGRVGDASYTCLDGEIKGEMLLKRQFQIEDKTLIGFDDIDITFDDELLRPYLNVSANIRLKNIIATIQSEQNRIIRANMFKPLIVQGVAGSGKTTVALHRIAYLIYTYAQMFKPEEYLIIAPNTIFLDYISNVLPDLGVENVRQQTFEAFAQMVIGKKLKTLDIGDKFARVLKNQDEAKTSQYKSSLKYRDAIDRYINDLENSFLPSKNFYVGKFIFCHYEKIQSMFISAYHEFPFSKRINLIKAQLSRAVEENGARVLAKIDADRLQKVASLQAEGLSTAEYKKGKIAIYDEHEEIVNDLSAGGNNAIKEYLKQIKLPSEISCYYDFVSNLENMKKYCVDIDEKTLSKIASTATMFKKDFFEFEDIAPIMYIHFRIHELDKKLSVQHVVIDEAQDISLFQFYVLKEILRYASFTILGDISQGIYGYRGTNDWNEVASGVFNGNCDLLTLTKSYRSTVEIIEQANIVLSKSPDVKNVTLAQPVIRSGEQVSFNSKKNADEIAESINVRIDELRASGMQNIAVICKTVENCEAFSKKIKAYRNDYKIISGKEIKYSGGISIIPSFLVKGLEFDAVIIADAHTYNADMLDIKLLYVVMTRAMHCMDIFFLGDKPELFIFM